MACINIEEAAMALGVWWPGVHAATTDRWPSGPVVMMPSATRDVRTAFAVYLRSDRLTRHVDELTAALLLLGHRRGLQVHVGRCRMCEGGKLEWQAADDDGPDGYYDTPDPFSDGGWSIGGSVVDENGEELWHWVRHCPKCSEPGPDVECEGTGKRPGPHAPTGEDRRPWAQAILDARHMIGRPWLAWRDLDLLDALAVLSDRMQPALEGHGEHDIAGEVLGAATIAFLAGSCLSCAGTGQQHLAAKGWRPGPREKPFDRQRRCQACGGHGTVLGAYADKLERALLTFVLGVEP
jgi:hypothetical protein